MKKELVKNFVSGYDVPPFVRPGQNTIGYALLSPGCSWTERRRGFPISLGEFLATSTSWALIYNSRPVSSFY